MNQDKINRYYMSLQGCNAHGHEIEPVEDNENGEWIKYEDFIQQKKILNDYVSDNWIMNKSLQEYEKQFSDELIKNRNLQSRIDVLEKANEDLKREPIGSRMCLTLMHNTMGLTTKISEGVDYIMKNTKEKQIEGSDFNYNLFYKINQMNNMLKKALDEFYIKYNQPNK